MPQSSHRIVGLVVGALLALRATTAFAIDIPNINGHMTDTPHTLSSADKNTVEDKLTKLQGDTRVDVAGWIVDQPETALDGLGHDAYQRWNIGRDWDNAVFFMIPKSGRIHVIQKDGHPELTPAEVSRILAADEPNAVMSTRLDAIVETTGKIIRAKALQARPPGATDPAGGRRYSIAFAVLLLGTLVLTVRARRTRPVGAHL